MRHSYKYQGKVYEEPSWDNLYDYKVPEGSILLIDEVHGTNIPIIFVKNFWNSIVSDVKNNNTVRDCCVNTEAELHLESWFEVLDSAVMSDTIGNLFTLYQEGDVWAIPLIERIKNN